MKTFLHVGCGTKNSKQTPFAGLGWEEIRLDIDPQVKPDVVGTMLNMEAVPSASVDAVFSSHNIEHLYPHEVQLALQEFHRILVPTGFALITCPDLQSVAALVAEGKLLEPAYTSPVGPIAPLDIIYGHRPAMAAGNLFMAHRCGFTRDVLIATLQQGGFCQVAASRRPGLFDLWALATKAIWSEGELTTAATQFIPGWGS